MLLFLYDVLIIFYLLIEKRGIPTTVGEELAHKGGSPWKVSSFFGIALSEPSNILNVLSRKFEKSEYIIRILRILLASLAPNALEISVPMLSLATTLYHLGRHREVEDLAQEALRICEASFDKESPTDGELCFLLGN